MKRFIKICEYILFLLFLVLVPFMDNKLSIVLMIPLLMLLYWLSKNLKIKNFTIFIFILAFIIRIISIIYLKVDIVDDFKTMLSASRDLINGNISFINSLYFKYFPYQLGHVLYQALFLKIIDSVLFLKIINSIITSFIIVFIYLISKNIVKENIARMITMLYLLYFYPIYLNSVLTNQHLPVLLSLVAIYMLITQKHTTKLTILVALILGIANIFRTESIIFIIGIVIYKLLIEKNSYKQKLIASTTLIVTYLLFNIMVSNIVYLTPLHTKLNNNYPEWKFYCGLSNKHDGLYNEEDQNIFFNTKDKQKLLTERIKSDKTKLPTLFLKKEIILWTQTNFDLRTKNNISNLLLYFNVGYLNIIIIIFIISLIPKRKTSKEELLIKIILALYYIVYMFIEISPRYAYILHILIFLLLGIGIENIKYFYENKIKKRIK